MFFAAPDCRGRLSLCLPSTRPGTEHADTETSVNEGRCWPWSQVTGWGQAGQGPGTGPFWSQVESGPAGASPIMGLPALTTQPPLLRIQGFPFKLVRIIGTRVHQTRFQAAETPCPALPCPVTPLTASLGKPQRLALEPDLVSALL